MDYIVEFVQSSDIAKQKNFRDALYKGSNYDGLFLECNEHIISSNGKEVLVVNEVLEEFGQFQSCNVRLTFSIKDFIFLVTQKERVL